MTAPLSERPPRPETMRKQCDCPNASASGPRAVPAVGEDEFGGLRCTITVVRFACDVCDTPWRRDD